MSIDKNFPKNKEELFSSFKQYLEEEVALESSTLNGYLGELKKSLVDYRIEEINHENILKLKDDFEIYRKENKQTAKWKQSEEVDFKIKQKKISSLLPYSNGSFSASLPYFIDYLKYKNISLNDFPTFLDNSAIQKIYAGAPGTGKSFKIENEILSGIDKENNVSRVTFYPDYEYHNFVGSILPVVDNGKVTYKFVKGPFTDILIKALNDKNNHYYLVIEEMTRGNCAAIFGDLFQLLDRNSKEDEANEKGIYGQSKYPINNLQLNKIIKENVEGYKSNKVYLPANLSIIGTINTSDQNIFTMDTAFKRRFQFEYLIIEDNQDKIKDDINFLDKPWKDFYIKLNEYLLNNLEVTEDKQLGPFFINSSDDNVKVIMYLWQDVIGMYNKHSKLFNSKINTLGDALKVDSTEDLFSEEFIEFLKKGI